MEDRKRVARGVPPRGCPEGRSQLHAEALVEGFDPDVDVTVRVQQTVERQVLNAQGEGVEYLVIASTRYASRKETIEHEIWIPSLPGRAAHIETAGEKRAELVEHGVPAGALHWRWEPFHATIEAWMEEIIPGLRRVQVSVANRLELEDGETEQPLMRTFYSTEVVMHSSNGAFASLSDPPMHLREHSAACCNEGLWPVPIGEAGDRRTMLASQIPLEDYHRPYPTPAPSPSVASTPPTQERPPAPATPPKGAPNAPRWAALR